MKIQAGQIYNILTSLKKKQNLKEHNEKEMIIRLLINAKEDWINANNDFNHAYKSEFVDSCTYRIKACEEKYEYYLRMAKEKNITL